MTAVGLLLVAALLMAPVRGILSPHDQCTAANLCRQQDMTLVCQCGTQCQDLNIETFRLPHSNDYCSSVIVRNCARVNIGSGSIQEMRNLRNLLVENVGRLQLHDKSLYWPGYQQDQWSLDHAVPSLSITLRQVWLPELPGRALGGQMQALTLDAVHVGSVASFAVNPLSTARLHRVLIHNCTLDHVREQAFKRLNTERLELSETRFLDLPSRAFADIDILRTFSIDNCHFNTLKPAAFSINNPERVDILNSQFGLLESECLKIRARGVVTIKHNQFRSVLGGAFQGIGLIREQRTSPTQALLFNNNTLTNWTKDALQFDRTSFTPKFGAIILNRVCQCADIQSWSTGEDWYEHIHCFTDSRMSNTSEAVAFNKSKCSAESSSWIIVVSVLAVLLVLLVAVSVVIVFVYRRYRRQKRKEYVNRGRPKAGSLGLVVPDGRTYRETELHVVVEKAELLTTDL